MGLFAGIGIWLSPEAMPFGLMAFGAVFLSWATRPTPGTAGALAASGCVFLAIIAIGVLIDPPRAGRSVAEFDRISVVFLCQAAIVCALCWVPRGLAPLGLSWPLRFSLIGMAGAAGVALWLSLFPDYLRGLAGLMTPEEVAALFPSNAEWAPLDSPGLFWAVAGPGTLAVAAAFALAVWPRRNLAGILWACARACGTA